MKNDISSAILFIKEQDRINQETNLPLLRMEELLFSWHNHLMAEMEKEVSDYEIEKEGNIIYKGGQEQGIYDFYKGCYNIRSKIFPK